MRDAKKMRLVLGRLVGLTLGLVFFGAGVAAGDAASVGAGVGSESEAPTRDAGYRSELERIWLTPGASLDVRGQRIRRRALALGAANLDSPARALIGEDDDKNGFARRQLAVLLAPDLPLAHGALGAAYWRKGEYALALAEYSQSFLSIPRHLEASVWLVGSLLMILAGVLISGSLAFIFVEGFSGFSRAAHDLGDLISDRMPTFARAALVFSVLAIPLLLGEGVLGVAAIFLAIAVAYGRALDRGVLILAALTLWVGVYPCLEGSGRLLMALNADPLASASLALIRGSETPQQLALLLEAEGRGDPLVDRTLAVRARRMGANQEAAERFQRLVETDSSDQFALTILGNIAFEAGDTAGAIAFYEAGRQVQGESAELMFDLSQAYAKVFRMEDGEFAMARAQQVNGTAVAEFLGLDDSNFVADPAFPIAPIRRRMVAAASGRPMAEAVLALIAPGRLGEQPRFLAGGLALAILLGFLLQGRFEHASQCLRCGRRICVRCDGEMWSSDLCGACHHLFHRPEDTDHLLREARIEQLQAREERLEKMGVIASVLLPGFAGMRARRPDLAFASLLLFVGVLLFVIWRGGVVPDPLAVGVGGTFALGVAAFLVSIVYLGVLFTSLISWRRP
jgi:tetratricopeptide (TPR) repeat protein